MANYRGQDGSVTILSGGTTPAVVSVAQVKQWDCQITQDLLDASVMGDDWKAYRGGMASWSGSMEVLFDYSDAGQKTAVDKLATPAPDGTTAAVNLQIVGTSKEINGNVIIKGFAVTDTLNDLVKLRIDFEGSGPPTLVWTP